jgi:Ca2+-transporting ATPase
MSKAQSSATDSTLQPFAVAADAVLESLGSERTQGLTEARVAERRAEYGYNELAEAPPVPLWKKLASQFKDLVIWILIVAAVIAGAMGEWADTLAILAIVLLNGIIGFLQEEKAERALASLHKLSAPMAKVTRGAQLVTLPAREIVPGDRIELEAGDNVPADSRLIEAFGLRVQEAALTGESTPVDKEADCVLDAATALGDRRNMLFMGTVLAAGKGSAVVTSTGMHTELGQIAGLLQRYEPEPTPLQRRLAELGKVLVIVCLAIVSVIFVLQILRQPHLRQLLGDLRFVALLVDPKMLDVFLTAVSLAVAAVPEGLPAVVTLSLALGLQRMVKRNALVRKLPSVETLGSVTVICSDKTGTLTRNEMTVQEIVVGEVCYQVSGSGYTPRGQFHKRPAPCAGSSPHAELAGHSDQHWATDPDRSGDEYSEPVDPRSQPDLMQALTIAARCNNATVSPQGDSDAWQVIGDPTEGALMVAALKAGVESHDQEHGVLYEIPFDSERKAMSIVRRGRDGGAVMYTKGAPEVILSKCSSERRDGQIHPLTDERRKQIMQVNSAMASRALRVLALAYREQPSRSGDGYEEQDLVVAGLMGMIDPPRDEVRDAVRKCRDAGIRPVMITGDHPDTALAIARELRIATGDERAITGNALDATPDDELADQVKAISVYARVSAEHKLRVVRAWRTRGQVVAMTGDGVNDAPAVKAADIGIAMGGTGTDVTKEASDMVLTDDNFTSIVNAVEEGRGIFDNIQKFVHYLLSCNAGEVLLMFVAALAGWPVPLMAIQILWINLVTDGLPALALAMEPTERDIMRRKPRPPREPVITLQRGFLILFHGTLVATVALIGFWLMYRGDPDNLDRARTVTFCITALAQLFFSIGCRSHHYTMPELGPFSNPHLFGAIAISGLLQLAVVTIPFAQPIFQVNRHLGWEWLLVVGLSLMPVTIIEVVKLVRAAARRRMP